MDATFEQASQFLDQALLSYAGGQIEEASQSLASAAAVLREIHLVSIQPQAEPVSGQPVTLELLLVTGQAMPLLPVAIPTPAPAAIQPVAAEPAAQPSLAVAA